ncbi:MAG TPA: efflux RND transporter periplasmic adaptor subunit, partial [Bradyrhizobium sp.]|nr:efflux RND transporter periplasmic adaptor subunit [Bradyrhizobium sp.]
MALPVTNSRAAVMLMGVAVAVMLLAYGGWRWSDAARPGLATAANANAAPGDASGVPAARERDSVDLSDAQLAYVKVEPVEERDFPVEKEAVGSIDFDEDMAVQVFTPYQGRIIALYASVGDDVKKGQTLFTIDSPDLLQAESTLIAAAGVREFT